VGGDFYSQFSEGSMWNIRCGAKAAQTLWVCDEIKPEGLRDDVTRSCGTQISGGHIIALVAAARYGLQLRNSLSVTIILKLKYVKHSGALFLSHGVRTTK
jgi:hypothetical protein